MTLLEDRMATIHPSPEPGDSRSVGSSHTRVSFLARTRTLCPARLDDDVASVYTADTALASHELALNQTGWESSALCQIMRNVTACRPHGHRSLWLHLSRSRTECQESSPSSLQKSWKVYTQMCKSRK